jgi:hypothetical protein
MAMTSDAGDLSIGADDGAGAAAIAGKASGDGHGGTDALKPFYLPAGQSVSHGGGVKRHESIFV